MYGPALYGIPGGQPGGGPGGIAPGGIAPGERTARYQLARDAIGNREASSTLISMEDYAVAVVDEAERAEHPRACVVAMR